MKDLEEMPFEDQPAAVDGEVWWSNNFASSDGMEFLSTSAAVIESGNVAEDSSSFSVDDDSESAEFPEVDNDDILENSPSTPIISGPKFDKN